MWVELDSGEVVCWEIPGRMRELLELIEQASEIGRGVVVAVWRERAAANSRIDARVITVVDVDPLDVWAFVATLGNGSVAKLNPAQSESVDARSAMTHVIT